MSGGPRRCCAVKNQRPRGRTARYGSRLCASSLSLASRRYGSAPMEMPVRRVKASPKVEADIDRVALMCGPLVYCVKGVDNPQGVRNLIVGPNVKFVADYRKDLLGGVTVLRGSATAAYVGNDGEPEAEACRCAGHSLLCELKPPAVRNAGLVSGEGRSMQPPSAAQCQITLHVDSAGWSFGWTRYNCASPKSSIGYECSTDSRRSPCGT